MQKRIDMTFRHFDFYSNTALFNNTFELIIHMWIVTATRFTIKLTSTNEFEVFSIDIIDTAKFDYVTVTL